VYQLNQVKSGTYRLPGIITATIKKIMTAMQKCFFIKVCRKYVKVNFHEIIYVEGCQNYVKIVTENKTHLVLNTLKRLEQLLPPGLFRRIHKSFIVSLDKIIEFDGGRVYLQDKVLPIGQQYKRELEKSVIMDNDSASESELSNLFYSEPMGNNGNQKGNIFEAE